MSHRSLHLPARQPTGIHNASRLCKSCPPVHRHSARVHRQICRAGKGESATLPAGAGSVVTDSSVPEGHKGLHGFLYGDGGAEVHDGADRQYQSREGEDDGTTLVPVAQYLEARDGEKPLGVYALYDSSRNLQYVGYGRNIILAVKGHLGRIGEERFACFEALDMGHLGRVGEERCAYIRALVVVNQALMSRQHLEEQAQNWLAEAGTTPPGNGIDRSDWEGPPKAGLSEADAAALEERALKMRKAMGENLADDIAGESPDARTRRLNLIKAVEGDDWSSVIDGQTAETIANSNPVDDTHQYPIATPFARASVHRSIGEPSAGEAPDLTPEAVNAALDEVRPYLIADGGNVEVAGVEDGTVYLRLQGACGTCPSSAGTMKMGIERALQGAFGSKLKGVQQLDAVSTSANVPAVDAHLDMLRPAIASYGAKVEVLSVEQGVCKVKFDGPPPIGMGVQAAIKDKFPDIKSVELVR